MEGTPKAASARRRRLVERGSDRLAFITGQAKQLPSDPYPDTPVSSTASPQVSKQQPSEGSNGSDKFSNIIQSQKSEPGDVISAIQLTGEARQQNEVEKFKKSSGVPEIQPVSEPLLRSRDHETVSKKTSNDDVTNAQHTREAEVRPRSVPLDQSNQAGKAAWSLGTLKEYLDFTPQEISQAISATEYSRCLVSIVIAFLVVLSNWGLDIVGGYITRVLVGTRPLLFLIITNVTIVLTSLMENKDPNARGRPAGSISLVSADSFALLLEIGLLLQNALGSLLMDCSVCAVIMICFLGF